MVGIKRKRKNRGRRDERGESREFWSFIEKDSEKAGWKVGSGKNGVVC